MNREIGRDKICAVFAAFSILTAAPIDKELLGTNDFNNETSRPDGDGSYVSAGIWFWGTDD